MAELPFEGTIQIAKRLGDDRAEQILAFWSDNGLLDEDTARLRLLEVVCVLFDEAGALVGVNSVHSDHVPLVAGRRFWMYRSYLLPGAVKAGPAMIAPRSTRSRRCSSPPARGRSGSAT